MTVKELQITEYECQTHLNIYDSAQCDHLATQAATGRHLQIISIVEDAAIAVCLCEDGYPGWLSRSDVAGLKVASQAYQAKCVAEMEIRKLIPRVIAFTQAAMQQPNYYFWGGTVGPNYDCSGLMQAAFASVGVWLPRDAYQQEKFALAITVEEMIPGDLVFFGVERATHVGLYLGDGCYVHSSGEKMGRNGIGIDRLSEQGDKVSRSYYQQLRGAGRIIESYEPY
ncbi:C40 family peptidase [Gloeocapsopsis crepidinum LEGE 06123]|uniref:C40 family peptidase n=1 Tax=Gloeocapsopsis crepidinum LEGE 06123 TaxID=588587 RepID=A0ABR9URH2_9CHRO|nr:C40 family peptidase [Gloeocapsopsis crepidinum]MBE9190859.1 C40 family peptidase [Gloeocapsopsis crepidinum LEGE 06123]